MIFSFNGETGCIKGSRSSFRVNRCPLPCPWTPPPPSDSDNDIPDGDIHCEVTASSRQRGWETRGSPTMLDSIQELGERHYL